MSINFFSERVFSVYEQVNYEDGNILNNRIYLRNMCSARIWCYMGMDLCDLTNQH